MADTKLIDCPSCGATNRVPLSKIAQGLQPNCGRCKNPLHLDSKLVTVTDKTFASAIERSPLPVLLDVGAVVRSLPDCRPHNRRSSGTDGRASACRHAQYR